MACDKKQAYYPKPKGFPRIDIPAHKYLVYDNEAPFTFEFSKIAEVLPDKSINAEPHWLIVNYPSLGAKIQFTYKPLNGDLKKLDAHISDAFKLASKHQVKAISQTERVIKMANGRQAVTIDIEGEVPSHFQFYTTDTSRHYLRGVLYLNRATLNDSLSPIVDYVKADCRRILETLKWKK